MVILPTGVYDVLPPVEVAPVPRIVVVGVPAVLLDAIINLLDKLGTVTPFTCPI